MQQFRLSFSQHHDILQLPVLITLCPHCVNSAADHAILEIYGQEDRACELCGEEEEVIAA
jgi:hypothetical protein